MKLNKSNFIFQEKNNPIINRCNHLLSDNELKINQEIYKNLLKETGDSLIHLKDYENLKPEYKEKSKVKFRVVGRELYPTRGFDTTPAALTVKYLPSGSRTLQQGAYYSVKDAETEDVIIPFSTGSIISCDSTSNYFNLWMDGFQPERFYRFEIKVVSGSGAEQTSMIYDDEFTFKVVR